MEICHQVGIKVAFVYDISDVHTSVIPTAVIEVFHTVVTYILNKGLDFFITLHLLIAVVINADHIGHKATRR